MSREEPVFRCWCEQCDWEQEVQGRERSAAVMMLNHGVATGHHETYREPVEGGW